MNFHTPFDTVTDEERPSLSQLLYTHEKLENLARGPLSRPVIEQIKDTAQGVLLEIGKAPAMSWDELHRKVAALLDDYDDASTFMEVFNNDICRLAWPTKMAQAAE